MKRLELPPEKLPETKVFLIHIGPAAKKRSFTLMEEFRAEGVGAGESISKDNLKTQLNIAAKIGAKFALILGQKEAMENSVIVRCMANQSQETVPLPNLQKYLEKILK